MFEPLESRRLMSSSPFLGNDCLPTGPASHRPPASAPSSTPSKPTRPAVNTDVAGTYNGTANRVDVAYTGGVKLIVTRRSNGELSATFKFDRRDDSPYEIKTAFRLFSDGRFTLQSISPKLFVRVDGTFSPNNGETGGLTGTFQYWTPQGTAKSNFSVFRQGSLVA